MKLLIIRHGDPDYSIDHLTPKGKQEAQALADYLGTARIDRIFSSPLGRALATAEYTSNASGVPVEVQPWSAELNLWGSRIKGMVWDIHACLLGENRAAVEAMRPHLTDEEYARMQEELERVACESDRFLVTLGFHREGGQYRIKRPSKERILFFCHGGLGLTWLSHLLCIPFPAMWGGFFFPTSSITEVLFDERIPGIATPRCLGLGMLPHLALAGLESSRAGIKANWE